MVIPNIDIEQFFSMMNKEQLIKTKEQFKEKIKILDELIKKK